MNPVTVGTGPYSVPHSELLGSDWKIIALIYDNLLGINPYNPIEETGMLAESWTGLIEQTSGPYAGLYYIDFTLRPGVTFHGDSDGDGLPDPLRPRDVKFSLEFTKAAGPAVAYHYADLKSIHHVDTADEDPSLGPRDVRVYFELGVKSYWALRWVGFAPIMNERLWMRANKLYEWGYVYGETDWHNFPNRFLLWNYLPWQSDVDGDGITDLEEDGTGPWIFQSLSPSQVALTANTNYYISQDCVSKYLEWAFWSIGDTTRDKVIDIADGYKIALAFGTEPGDPGYDPDADIAGTPPGVGPRWDWTTCTAIPPDPQRIDVFDLAKWALHYGQQA